ncbi:MAG: ACT domain-containing protein, partial [Actinomycetota bacterium]|nr:ACT domain-containing protein [Actinomycetota bacterium]
MSYLLRLIVPDRPGVLGAVATALGEAGIDIVSLDVLERTGEVAVDDVVVELPSGRLPDSLITAAQA